MTTDEIRGRLFALRDIPYRDFQSGLIPNVDKELLIGVRTPALRALAKELSKQADTGAFLSTLPHTYFDENQLHAFLISEIKDFAACVEATEAFLPYVDNWATCDQLSPKVFKKHREELLPYIFRWLRSDRTYTVRFAVGMLMAHFLDEAFSAEYLDSVASLHSEEYYINMMIAWYFATALAKQYDAALPYMEQRRLSAWTHNKVIQKAVESRRVTEEQKLYLKTLKIR